MSEKDQGIKRYSLNLPMDLYQQFEKIAVERQTTIVELIRNAIRLLLIFDGLYKEGGKIIVKLPDGKERELIIPW